MGGMEAVAWDLSRALAARGHEVEILTTRCDALPPVSEVEGVRLRTMDVRSGRYSRAYWQETAERFEKEYQHRVDVILGVGAGAYAIAHKRSKGGGPALIMQSHGQAWGEMISKLSVPKPASWLKAPKNAYGILAERALRRFDRVVAVGPAVEQVLRSAPTRWMLGTTPVSVIPNGIDEEHFTFDPRARAEIRTGLSIGWDDPVLISASRLHVQKGIHRALDGFALARKSVPNLRFIIAGSGPAESDLRAHADRLGVAHSCHFVGGVKRDNLPGILSAGDAFIFTSTRREGLALGPLEAAAAGLPCILSRHLAIPGLSTPLVDPHHAPSVALAITDTLSVLKVQKPSLLPDKYSLRVASERYQQIFTEEISCRS